MTITINAIFENGVLRPTEPLALQEHAKVRVTIEPSRSWVDATAGMIGWKGSSEELDYFASDPEFDPQESA